MRAINYIRLHCGSRTFSDAKTWPACPTGTECAGGVTVVSRRRSQFPRLRDPRRTQMTVTPPAGRNERTERTGGLLGPDGADEEPVMFALCGEAKGTRQGWGENGGPSRYGRSWSEGERQRSLPPQSATTTATTKPVRSAPERQSTRGERFMPHECKGRWRVEGFSDRGPTADARVQQLLQII